MENPPQLVPIGFKEWSSVCAAIGAGRQTIILRKGGIAEGRTGFSFKYPSFFLFPTLFHQQKERVRENFEDVDLPVAGDKIPIKIFGEVVWKGDLDDWEKIRRLAPLHIWKEDVIRERFVFSEEAGEGSLQLAVLRTWRLASTWWIPDQRSYGGCRSWVDLPEIPAEVSRAGLSVVAAQRGRKEMVGLLDQVGINVSV